MLTKITHICRRINLSFSNNINSIYKIENYNFVSNFHSMLEKCKRLKRLALCIYQRDVKIVSEKNARNVIFAL